MVTWFIEFFFIAVHLNRKWEGKKLKLSLRMNNPKKPEMYITRRVACTRQLAVVPNLEKFKLKYDEKTRFN